MILIHAVGRHEVRLAEPALVALRLRGDLTWPEISELLFVIREHITGRDGRILIDVTELGRIPANWLQELDSFNREIANHSGHARDIVFIRTHMLHKVLLAPLPTRASAPTAARLQARFFQAQDDALAWLHLVGPELFAPDAVYVTRFY